jgi:hypothetical protein
MVKKRKFWTPLKIIVTVLIVLVLLFILYKLGVFNFITDRFLSTSTGGVQETISGAGNGGGGP